MPSVSSLSLAIRTRAPKGSGALHARASVYLRYCELGVMHYIQTGEQVETSVWDQAEAKLRIPPRLSKAEHEARQSVNDRLAALLQRARAVLVEAERSGAHGSKQLLVSAIKGQAGGEAGNGSGVHTLVDISTLGMASDKAVASGRRKAPAKQSLLELWQHFVHEAASGGALTGQGKRVKPATVTAYQQALNSVAAWAGATGYAPDFDTLDRRACERYTSWLLAQGANPSTANTRIKNLKLFCKWAERAEHTAVSHYKNMVRPTAPRTDFVFLSESELSALAAQVLPVHLERLRDLFVLQASTGLRYSDLVNLKAESRQGTRLRITTVKTEDALSIPLTPRALSILDKYAETGLPKAIQSQPYNRQLKEACRLAGICEPTVLSHFVSGRRAERTVEKWQLVSSHTARRTFIIHALERGIRPEVLMRVTGHKDIKTMMGYVKIVDSVVGQEFERAFGVGTV